MAAAPLNRGMLMDVDVGESVILVPSSDSQRIVVTVEHKSGSRSRIRIQSDDKVRVESAKYPKAG